MMVTKKARRQLGLKQTLKGASLLSKQVFSYNLHKKEWEESFTEIYLACKYLHVAATFSYETQKMHLNNGSIFSYFNSSTSQSQTLFFTCTQQSLDGPESLDLMHNNDYSLASLFVLPIRAIDNETSSQSSPNKF